MHVNGVEYNLPSYATTYSNCAIIEGKSTQFLLYWRYDDTDIFFGIDTISRGYVSIGFSTNGKQISAGEAPGKYNHK